MEGFYQEQQGTMYAKLYGFRFTGNADVTIACRVRVCKTYECGFGKDEVCLYNFDVRFKEHHFNFCSCMFLICIIMYKCVIASACDHTNTQNRDLC